MCGSTGPRCEWPHRVFLQPPWAMLGFSWHLPCMVLSVLAEFFALAAYPWEFAWLYLDFFFFKDSVRFCCVHHLRDKQVIPFLFQLQLPLQNPPSS